MAIKKMGLAWIAVSDMNQTKKFFIDTLGLQVSSDSAEHGWLELKAPEGDMLLGIAQESADDEFENAGTNAVVTFTVDNIEQTKADLEKKGVEFDDEIMEVPGHVKIVTFGDPDGNTFQLVEELS